MTGTEPTNPQVEADRGRIALWLAPADLAWLAKHCGCGVDASEEEKDHCGRIRFRASAALHKHGRSG
ncbi:hypothetical protein [Kitasatospora sp. NPDC054795]